MKKITLMVQGTTSDAGKSTLVAGLCRALKNRGIKVAPFKPQNMALNSAVTENGGEIGRAQALQALACGLEPHTDMNPVLLKPSSDTGAQIIIHGKVKHDMDAKGYHAYKPTAKRAVMESYARLQEQYEAVLVEGAGSPAEVNLRQGDIANMGFAEAADCPVIIVADIDKGGVFAHLVGTLDLLSPSEQNRVIGFVINKFRGDIALLEPGLEWLEKRTGKPVFGVLPYLHEFYIDAEDAVATEQKRDDGENLNVVVPVFPRISNHTDVDPLRLHPKVNLTYVPTGQTPPPCDLIVLPGSKNVRQDFQWLKENHWPAYIQKHLRYGGKVIGICGGFQMLGEEIRDPLGIEGQKGEEKGLALIPIATELARDKMLKQEQGKLTINGQQCAVKGYEIHHGESQIIQDELELGCPCITLSSDEPQGYLNKENNILGCYLHGLFDHADACQLLLNWAGLEDDVSVDVDQIREQQIARLAQSIEEHLNIEQLFSAIEGTT